MIPCPTLSSDRIFIDHIPRLEWGKNTENSFIRSTQLTLNTLEESYTYPFIMGISGAAFRFHFDPDWCPSAADATTGFDVSKVLFKSLGYKVELLKIDDHSFSDIQRLYGKTIDQIDRGIPIIAINLKVGPEWGIITGYLKNKPGILCRTYYDENDDYSLAEHAPWLSFFIHPEKGNSYSDERLFFNSIYIAIQNATTSYFDDYTSGFTAFEIWINHLNKFIDVKQEFEHGEVNRTLVKQLIDARSAAVEYLKEMTSAFPIKNGSAIIDNYENELLILEYLNHHVLPEFEDDISSWTRNVLEEQVRILDKTLNIEKENITLMKEALT